MEKGAREALKMDQHPSSACLLITVSAMWQHEVQRQGTSVTWLCISSFFHANFTAVRLPYVFARLRRQTKYQRLCCVSFFIAGSHAENNLIITVIWSPTHKQRYLSCSYSEFWFLVSRLVECLYLSERFHIFFIVCFAGMEVYVFAPSGNITCWVTQHVLQDLQSRHRISISVLAYSAGGRWK